MKVPETPTASQTVGPFFSIGLDAFLRGEAAGAGTDEDRVTVRGRVMDGDGQPVPDAVLEIWAPLNERDGVDEDGYPIGFARVATNDCGEFAFTVWRAVSQEHEGKVHAPHVAVLVFMRGLLRHLVTRMYFANEAANRKDSVLKMAPEDRRETLIAQATGQPGQFLWDIHLQGEHETVFFDV
jgi:protocatechuate 3,4-dioxygenase, alpha subunit